MSDILPKLMPLSAQELYLIYQTSMTFSNVETDPWEDLFPEEQQAWEAVAVAAKTEA
jgi:hypothetical protein